MRIETFIIHGVFGRHTVRLSFTDNKLILVGENGSGKSTSLSILYYFLTRQWTRLAEMPFDKVDATIDGRQLTVQRDELTKNLAHTRHGAWGFLRRHLGPMRLERLSRELAERPIAWWMSNPDRVRKLGGSYDVDFEIILDAVMMGPRGNAEDAKAKTPLARTTRELEAIVTPQILFLPTYRRIERDLQHIFPGIRVDRDLRTFQRSNREAGGYVELVEFGMKDVEDAFSLAMQRLDREFRADLNRLTGEYLRDVLRGIQTRDKSYDGTLAESASLIDVVLSKMDNTVLEPDDREALRQLISTISSKKEIPPGKEVAAHFLSKLVEIYHRQESREQRVRLLTTTCNEYLESKRLAFDPVHFQLRFILSERGHGAKPVAPDGSLPPDSLSSGEKQIVSLFTHILLSERPTDPAGPSDYFLIIDEPELSISVDWQRMLLPDIMKTGLCSGFVAVTHSPFVFENNLGVFAHSMAEFVA